MDLQNLVGFVENKFMTNIWFVKCVDITHAKPVYLDDQSIDVYIFTKFILLTYLHFGHQNIHKVIH